MCQNISNQLCSFLIKISFTERQTNFFLSFSSSSSSSFVRMCLVGREACTERNVSSCTTNLCWSDDSNLGLGKQTAGQNWKQKLPPSSVRARLHDDGGVHLFTNPFFLVVRESNKITYITRAWHQYYLVSEPSVTWNSQNLHQYLEILLSSLAFLASIFITLQHSIKACSNKQNLEFQFSLHINNIVEQTEMTLRTDHTSNIV